MMVRNAPDHVSTVHPAQLGFTLERKPMMNIENQKLMYMLVQDKKKATTCGVCTIGKPGTPTYYTYLGASSVVCF